MLFFNNYVYKSEKDKLLQEGEILSKLLAHSARLGVFSENEALLKDPLIGILNHDEVIEASIYNVYGKLLYNMQKDPENPLNQNITKVSKIFAGLKKQRRPLHVQNEISLNFFNLVTSKPILSHEESIFFQEASQQENRILGFVKISLSKKKMHKKIQSLLFSCLLIGFIFLLLGCFFIYLISKSVTQPLLRLTKSVQAFGEGIPVAQVPVETKDEIGKLATAFNTMAESLQKREKEKKALEKQLIHAQKMESIGTLAGGISHDFNNILNAIMGYASLLQIELEENSPLRFDVDQILGATERAATLTKNLLAFSRKQNMEFLPVNCNDIITSVKQLLVRLVNEDIEFKLNLTKENLLILGDRGQIDQILFNLVTNAKDAMPDGGVLSITTEAVELSPSFFEAKKKCIEKEKGNYALIAVSDTGTGMDERTKERIFDPFYTTKEVGKGTGLGLSMAYGIVKQHHGFIDVISTPEVGTEFKIYFPLIQSGIKEKEKEEERQPVIVGGDETLLIAEDDHHNKALSREIFERLGYRVIVAKDGQDAINKFRENSESIGLLLFDVFMPKRNGKEAYEEIKKLNPNIKSIFLSGYDREALQKAGVFDMETDIVFKPISPNKLLFKVRETLDA